MNGVELNNHIFVSCISRNILFFDEQECQAKNGLSPDRRTVSHTGARGHASVLGTRSIQSGSCYRWKVRIDKSKNSDANGMFIGVTEKDGLTSQSLSFHFAHCWNGWSGDKRVNGQWIDPFPYGRLQQWQQGDLLRFKLDFDAHTLRATSLSSLDTDQISGLPNAELRPYFSLYCTGDSLSLVD